MFKIRIKYIVVIACLLSIYFNAYAALPQSEHYKLRKQSFNNGGIDDATSENFRKKDTLAEPAIGESQSENNKDYAGYRGMSESQAPFISLDLSVNAIDFGVVTSQLLSEKDVEAMVNTNVFSGYNLFITEDGNLRKPSGVNIADVNDGTVDIGNSEYGFESDGDDVFGSGDRPVTSSETLIATRASSTPLAGIETLIKYKLAIAETQEAGHYEHITKYYAYPRF